jgi:phosphate-selective porin O/P
VGVAPVAPPTTPAPAPPSSSVGAPADAAPALAPEPATFAPEAPVQESKPVAEISAAPGKGFTIKYGDAFSFNLRSRFQLRYQLDIPPEDDAGDRNYQQLINIGTARLWFSGNVFRPELTYMIQLAVAGRDYRDGAISPIFDAFVDWKAHRDFNIRAGQFFVPFDRLRTVREFALQMADRPVPIGELTLDRDAGVAFYSDKFLGSPFAWRAGIFGGGGTNLSTGKEPGFLLTARLEARPLGPIDDDSEGDLERRSKPGLAIGAGIARNWNTNRQRSTTGLTFAGGTTDYLHLAADAVFKWQGFAAQLEYLWKNASEDQILSTNADGPVTEWTRSASGWVAQASYTFDPPFEIVGRFSKLYASSGTDPRLVDADEVGVGLNYYINGHQFKIQTDWIAKVPTESDFDDAAHVAHLQLDATF